MSKEIEEVKKIELCNGKQLFGKLKHFISEWYGTITIKIVGTVTPIEIVSSSDFKKTDLFEIKSCNHISMMRGIDLPSFKILEKDLWCPALKNEILARLNYLKSIQTFCFSSSLVEMSISYIIKKLSQEDKKLELTLPEQAKLIGELKIDDDYPDIKILGNVRFPDSQEKMIEFFEIKNILCHWLPFSDPTTRFIRKNKQLWNEKLKNLIIALLLETKDFTNFKKDIEKAVKYLETKSIKAKIINQLKDGLLKSGEEDFWASETVRAMKIIAGRCKFNLNLE